MRSNGLKAVLRFAYEKTNENPPNGPTKDVILGHIEQLKPVVAENADVIFIMQAGFIGAWGEWHSAVHIPFDDHQARSEILAKILELLPEDRMTQVRVPKYKHTLVPLITGRPYKVLTAANAFTGIPEARIGFNNDGVLAGASHGGTWPEAPLFGRPGNPEFDRATRESAWVPTEGELFWSDLGWDGKEADGKGVGGLEAARYLRLQRFVCLSVAHSYSEREGELLSIDRWRSTPVTLEQLTAEKLPVSDEWFEDAFGNHVERTQFEYIRDHLGYRLELQWAELPAAVSPGGELAVELELINRGFSILFNPRTAYIVLVSPDESRILEFPVEADPRDWQPHEPGDADYEPSRHRISLRANLPADLEPGVYAVGLWLPDAKESIRLDPRYAVRMANRDTAWWADLQGRYGVNMLKTVRVE